MDIKSLKDLTKLINLCRKNGINFIKDAKSGIELEFGPVTSKRQGRRVSTLIPSEQQVDLMDDLSPDDILLYSSRAMDDMETKATI